jgi:signal transduction histidine kinase
MLLHQVLPWITPLAVVFVVVQDVTHAHGQAPWVTATKVALIGMWLLATYIAPSSWSPAAKQVSGGRVATRAIAGTLAVAAAAVVVTTANFAIVPLGFVVVILITDSNIPLWSSIGAAALGAALIPIRAVGRPDHLTQVLALEATMVVWVLFGLVRRQYRAGALQAGRLEATEAERREQEVRATVLAERQSVARDLHDVLAHSLGGLAIHLSAAEALLESGRVDEATRKVAQARVLAAEGLAEARQAVATLRVEPSEASRNMMTMGDLASAALDLVRAHREMGGAITATIDLGGTTGPLDPATGSALRRTLQEALSNVRLHAAGQPVTVTLLRTGGRLVLTVSNSLDTVRRPTAPRLTPGHGLAGMRERVAVLPGGRVDVETTADEFRLRVSVEGLS